jgi:hypothetical protein
MTRSVSAVVIAVLLGLGLVPFSVDGPASAGEPSSPAPGTRHPAPRSATGLSLWHPDKILDAGAPLNAVAAGDFVPGRPGNETLAADAQGRLWLAWRENYTWQSRAVWSAGGNTTSLSSGEFDGAAAGLEAACAVTLANGTGAVYVVSGLGEQASARRVLSSGSGIIALASGDVVQTTAGTEVVALDGNGNVSAAFPASPATDPQLIIRIPGATCLLAADLDSSRPGDEMAVGSASGNVSEIYWDGLGWREKSLWVSPSGIVSLAFGDADPLHDGPEIAMAAVSGGITLLERLGDAWTGRPVWSAGGPVTALAVGDADGDLPGNELLAGCPDNITRLRWSGQSWDREQLWGPSGTAGGLLVAEVDADHGGGEVLAAGQSGALAALGLYHPGFSMSAGDARRELAGGERASFALTFTPLDKLGGNLTLSVGALPAGISAVSGPGKLALAPPNVTVMLNLSINASVPNGEHRFLVTASHQAGMYDAVWLSLALDRKADHRLVLITKDPEVRPGETAVYTAIVINTGTVNDSYRLEAGVAGGWPVRLPGGNLTGTVAPGQNASLVLKVTAPGDAAGRTAKLTVNATSMAFQNQTRSASMKVVVPQKSAPCGLFLLPAGLVGTAFMLGRNGK